MSELVLMHHQEGISDLLSRAHARYLNCSDMTLEEAEKIGDVLATLQRDIHFWIGDLARYSESRWPDTHHQAWPHWVSPGMLSRTAGVCRAYPNESDRQHECTYSQFMQAAGRANRQKLLKEIVDNGLTTDESRKSVKSSQGGHKGPRWLIAIDVHYFLHRFYHSGAGVEAAVQVASWISRTVERMKRDMGLTDVACCFDSPINYRKKLTDEWDEKYKGDRGPKDMELSQQLKIVRELLDRDGFACVSLEGYEADDCIASYSKTFQGKVAILSQDKDLKQCLSGERVVMLLDVTWAEDDTSGEMIPVYHWYTEKKHSSIDCRNLLEDTGLTPHQFPDLQCLMGDSTDCIRGAPGVGIKHAITLIQEFGTADAAVDAALKSPERILKMKQGKKILSGLLELAPKLETTRKLVTLKDDLTVPTTTRI